MDCRATLAMTEKENVMTGELHEVLPLRAVVLSLVSPKKAASLTLFA